MLPTQAMSPCGAIRTDFAKSFRIIEDMPLGEGLTAEVWRAHELRNDRASSDDSSCGGMDRQLGKRQVAAKIFKQDAASDEPSYVSMPAALQREADLLAAVQGHPNVLRFHSVFWLSGDEVPQKGSEATLVSPRWCLTTELCSHGSLYSAVMRSRLQEPDAKNIMTGVLGALAHIHERGVLHRDVKLENVMLRSDSSPVLADFGLSCRMSDEQAVTSSCGSPGYTAPEVLMKKRWRAECDVFSAGVMLYIMLSGRQPFQGGTMIQTLRNTVHRAARFETRSFKNVSSEAKAFIGLLLTKTPEQRPSANKALREAWFIAATACRTKFSSEPVTCTSRSRSMVPLPVAWSVLCYETSPQQEDDQADHQLPEKAQLSKELSGCMPRSPLRNQPPSSDPLIIDSFKQHLPAKSTIVGRLLKPLGLRPHLCSGGKTSSVSPEPQTQNIQGHSTVPKAWST
mmetsp:Transcript_139958/g.354917  ORF Transcript_139958/g.354917 Transcript_139958/m.354917 type:complete len:455 (-) Transcript_139958:203-1567(-)